MGWKGRLEGAAMIAAVSAVAAVVFWGEFCRRLPNIQLEETSFLLDEFLSPGNRGVCCQFLHAFQVDPDPEPFNLSEAECCKEFHERKCLMTYASEFAEKLDIVGGAVASTLSSRTARFSSTYDGRAHMEKDDDVFTSIWAGANSSGLRTIALVVPTTSKGTTSVDEALVVNVLLRSVVQTATAGFRYVFYLSYNIGDPFFSEALTYARLVQLARQLVHSWAGEASRSASRKEDLQNVAFDFVRVPNPPSATAKTALSVLFNTPTLAAFADGCDFFYLVNDDLKLNTPTWTEDFTEALDQNPVFRGLGVVGAVDVSTPQQSHLEFPFFSRVHVSIFSFANPWTFRNWWEDNWLTDVYRPFQSDFYLKRHTVTNYAGLEEGTNMPRYEVKHNQVPCWYTRSVERGREHVRSFLIHQKDHREASQNSAMLRNLDLGYCTSTVEGTLVQQHRQHPHHPDPCSPLPLPRSPMWATKLKELLGERKADL